MIAADLIAAAMMVPKTYHDPGSETLATFVYASIGGALAAGAVGVADNAGATLLLYPIYYCLANGAIAVLIHHRRTVLRWRVAEQSAQDQPRPAPPGRGVSPHPAVPVEGSSVRVFSTGGRG